MRSIMQNKPFLICVVLTLVLTHWSANAYELGTHARITYKAYERSTLAQDSTLLKNLGIDINITADGTTPFGNIYYDINGTDARERSVNDFEVPFMTESKDNPNPAIPWGSNPLPRSLPGWLLRGAIREDDLMWPVGDNPQDDPYSPLGIMRVCNHFYDPINNQPLTIKSIRPCSLLLQPNDIAPQWAMGSTDVFTGPDTPDTSRRNHFTVFDAREAMYRALTGKTKDNTDAGPTSQPATATHRQAYWATVFRALGDIVHLVEDMAQPQHTRNDMHPDASLIEGSRA
jgi:hypothetical protein